jgi:hypothetical protein
VAKGVVLREKEVICIDGVSIALQERMHPISKAIFRLDERLVSKAVVPSGDTKMRVTPA